MKFVLSFNLNIDTSITDELSNLNLVFILSIFPAQRKTLSSQNQKNIKKDLLI